MSGLGIIARADNTGLGNLGMEFVRHLEPDRIMGVDLTAARSYTAMDDMRDRLPACTTWVLGHPTDSEVERFVDGLSVVLTFETAYNARLYRFAREAGCRTVLVTMPEYLTEQERPDLIVNPTGWLREAVSLHSVPVVSIPIPVATDRLQPHEGGAITHLVGRPALHDRNGTDIVRRAQPYIREPVCIRYQADGPTLKVSASVTTDEREDYWRVYDDVSLLLLPRRYGGLCLPMQEAAACGVPTIMLDIEPYKDLPEFLRVKATPYRKRRMRGGVVETFTTDGRHFAQRVNALSRWPHLADEARAWTVEWTRAHSWDALGGWWRSILT